MNHRSNSGQRIAHVLWQLDIGGAERAVYQLVREQRRAGIAADIIVGSKGGYYADCAAEEGARIIELGQSSAMDRARIHEFREHLENYDAIHFHSAEPLLIANATRSQKIRRFYTHRSGIFSYPWKKAIRYKWIGRHLRNNFHGISGNTTQGAVAAQNLFALSKGRVGVTYNGIDFSLLDPQRSREEILAEVNERTSEGLHPSEIVRIGTSANLRGWKRIERLLDAVAAIEYPMICYVIGDGPERAQLERHAIACGISDRVIFTGKKEHVGDYLQLLDIFVLPSGPEESFGNSAVEAMGVGLPTIVFSDGGGLVEHIEDGTTGYIIHSQDQLTERIGLLAQDTNLRKTIGSAARESARDRYSLQAMMERYTAFYRSGGFHLSGSR